jgi:hypothetical protein
MVITEFVVRITGGPQNYHVRLEAFGESDSIADLSERLRSLLGNIRLSTAEVDADLASGGSYEARSLPASSARSEVA